MISRSKKQILIYSAISTLTSCGGQRGPENSIDPEFDDNRPPHFVEKLNIQSLNPTSAEIVFSLDEKSFGSMIVRNEKILGLNHSEIEKANDKQIISVKAFETTRLPLRDLQPDWKYKVFLTVQDAAGNIIDEPEIIEFKTPDVPSISALTGTLSTARQGAFWAFTPSGVPEECQLKLTSSPTWMKVLPTGNTVGGIPEWKIGQETFDFTVKLIGNYCQGSAEFKGKIGGDPLFDYAWHINSKSKDSFSWFNAPPLHDFGISAALTKNLTGSGVHITIVDSGMQINHPDLKNNVYIEGNINLAPIHTVNCQVCDPKDTTPPLKEGAYGDQGTSVAGIIAAVGWNGIGSRGIAPNSKISAYNLSSPRFSELSESDYLRISSLKSDIICHSAVLEKGVLDQQQSFDFDSYDRSQRSKARVGRDGKGTIFIKAAGDLSTVEGNSIFDQRNGTNWGMVIGSYNIKSEKSLHSNPGSNIWITAPGGELGFQSDYKFLQTESSILNFYPGLVSTDVFNSEFPCKVGYSKLPQFFDPAIDLDPRYFNLGHSSGFNMGWHELNKDCQYNASIKSTPAAAAVTAGASALLIEYNPELTWRDLKHVLAKSAKPIHLDKANEVTSIQESLYEKTMAWITNSAGYKFHNWYGFGALDLAKALKIANPDTYINLPPQFDSGWELAGSAIQSIPPASISGVLANFFLLKDVITESIQIKLTIAHEDSSHLGIELISPNGTKSILKSVKDGSRIRNLNEFVFLSNAFYGERSRGTWQLKVVDGKNGKPMGSLQNWYFRVTGHDFKGSPK